MHPVGQRGLDRHTGLASGLQGLLGIGRRVCRVARRDHSHGLPLCGLFGTAGGGCVVQRPRAP
jgi:hypothetical protein